MKKRIISLVLAAVLVLSLTACGEQTADMGTSNSDLVYAMVSTTGSGYVAAAALADVINNNVDGLTVSCEVCGGLETLCQMIEAGEVDMANSATGIVYQYTKGVGFAEAIGPSEHIRILLPREVCGAHFVTTADRNDINTFRDFEGKKVVVGPSGSTIDNLTREIVPALGMNIKLVNATWGDCANALQDGDADGFWVVTTPPYSTITEMESAIELKYLTMEESDMEQVVNQYPWESIGMLNGSVYKYCNEDWLTLTSSFMTIASDRISQEEGYQIVKATVENLDDLKLAAAPFETFQIEDAISYGCVLHAGLVQYLVEQGFDVPEELIPAEYVPVA